MYKLPSCYHHVTCHHHVMLPSLSVNSIPPKHSLAACARVGQAFLAVEALALVSLARRPLSNYPRGNGGTPRYPNYPSKIWIWIYHDISKLLPALPASLNKPDGANRYKFLQIQMRKLKLNAEQKVKHGRLSEGNALGSDCCRAVRHRTVLRFTYTLGTGSQGPRVWRHLLAHTGEGNHVLGSVPPLMS